MSNTTPATAARAAGGSEAEHSALESSGTFAKRPNFAALAKAIGLSPAKLEGIANGWLPAQPDLNRWQRFQVFTTEGDGMTVNAYLIWDASTRQAAVFDTGFTARGILATVARERLQLQHIFITHSHQDHIEALGELRAAQPQAKVHGNSRHAPAEQRLKAGESFQIGGLVVTFRETPGHAADGVTYLIQGWPGNAPGVAIVGDTIFAGSVGRGNDGWDLARTKVREHILSLPAATLLGPGHGPLTTVAEEAEHNPFF